MTYLALFSSITWNASMWTHCAWRSQANVNACKCVDSAFHDESVKFTTMICCSSMFLSYVLPQTLCVQASSWCMRYLVKWCWCTLSGVAFRFMLTLSLCCIWLDEQWFSSAAVYGMPKKVFVGYEKPCLSSWPSWTFSQLCGPNGSAETAIHSLRSL